VTEMITGIDIVREQLLIAMGAPISFKQDQVVERGCAIELRINAEDPKNDFLSSPGVVQVYQSPGGHGVRLDGCIYQGYEITPYYDSMMVKLTVYGFNWREAVDRMSRALKGFLIIGAKTTIPYFQQIVQEPDFIAMKLIPPISTSTRNSWIIGKRNARWTRSPASSPRSTRMARTLMPN